jgi:Flp pilus assembly protein TadD
LRAILLSQFGDLDNAEQELHSLQSAKERVKSAEDIDLLKNPRSREEWLESLKSLPDVESLNSKAEKARIARAESSLKRLERILANVPLVNDKMISSVKSGIHTRRGDSLFFSGDYERAVDEYKRATVADEANARAFLLLGFIFKVFRINSAFRLFSIPSQGL